MRPGRSKRSNTPTCREKHEILVDSIRRSKDFTIRASRRVISSRSIQLKDQTFGIVRVLIEKQHGVEQEQTTVILAAKGLAYFDVVKLVAFFWVDTRTGGTQVSYLALGYNLAAARVERKDMILVELVDEKMRVMHSVPKRR